MNKPESVKLEIFSFVLNPIRELNDQNSFRDLISKISGIDNNQEIFHQFTQLFMNHVDLGYTEIRNKAFTLTTNASDYGFNLNDYSIWGVLKGGSKGKGKTKSPLHNREAEEDLSEDVINDKFFFYLNIPFDSNKGYLFFQVYGSESIRSEFIQHISDLFKISGQYLKPKCTPILPNVIRDEFKDNSKIIGLTYNNTVLSSALTSDPNFTNLCTNYNIEITIKPKGKSLISSNKIGLMNNVLSSLNFNNNSLINSTRKKVSLENLASKKTSTFELDVNDVMPRIYLLNRINIDKNGTPDFPNLKLYCDELLEELTLGEYTRIMRN